MDDQEAIAICRRWFRYLESQREKSITLQKAASLARAGDRDGARRLKNTVDSAPKVFDGATLLPAVEHLVKRVETNDR